MQLDTPDSGGEEGVGLDHGNDMERTRYRVDGRVKTRERGGGSGLRVEDPGGVNRTPLPAGHEQGGLRRRGFRHLPGASGDRTETGTGAQLHHLRGLHFSH